MAENRPGKAPVNVICMKWGTLYGPEYVNNLQRGVKKYLKRPHRFVCFTDDARGLNDEIECQPLPQLELPAGERDTRWKKLALFLPSLGNLTGATLFLDLDLVIIDSLDEFFDYGSGFHIIRDDDLFRAKPLRKINPARDRFFATVGNTSVFRYEIGEYAYVLENYLADPKAAIAAFENEQQFVSAEVARKNDLQYWPKQWCVSFKNDCVARNFRSYWTDPAPPPQAKIIVFAGTPKMDEVLAGGGNRWHRRIGDVSWLREAWSNA